MLSERDAQISMAYLPEFFCDRREPFPIRRIGCTVFREAGTSGSFPGLTLDPAEYGAELIVEYAVYFDYDIQHLYDLEHVWVAVDHDRTPTDCWCSFHGMRLRAAGLPRRLQWNGTRPILYLQPGKHAVMPDPELFGLHPQAQTCCGIHSGGGLLIPPMLRGRMQTDLQRDDRIRTYIREHFAFPPSWEFVPAHAAPDVLTDWPSLLDAIPDYVRQELEKIEI